MDPDWIFKNPNVLNIEVTEENSFEELDFSVTGAITINYPTNPPDSIYPFMADSGVVIFNWEPYSSTKEYIIEVKDLSGNIIWGGFESDSTINHAYIDDSVSSIEYNFDGSASVPELVSGEIYQWKLYADKGTHQNSIVEELISSSEDLRGIFQVP